MDQNLLFLFLALLCYCNATITQHNNNIRRLPGDLKPSFYSIRVHPYFDAPGVVFDPERDQTFDGEVSINFQVLKPTSTIILNAANLTFPCSNDKIVLSLTDMKPIKTSNFLVTPENQTITIELERELEFNENLQIKLNYIGQIGENIEFGLFKSTSKNSWTGVSDLVYATQFETTGARFVFPSFDEPDYKAIFQVTIVKPKEWIALSNTFNTSTKDIARAIFANGYEEVRFEKTEIISTYLIAIGIGDLVSIEGYTSDNILTRIWTFRSGKPYMKDALSAAIKCTDAMTNYTNFHLPLKKIDHLAIPYMGGAMENFGLIIYKQGMLLSDPIPTLETWMEKTLTICHELSHHWFGDTVTNKWWGDIFIHEGFASFFEYKAMTLAFPREKAFLDFKNAQSIANNLFKNDVFAYLDRVHPIITNNGVFDYVTYDIGSAVIEQLEALISPKVLQKGLQSYIQKYQFKNANYQQLLDEIQDAVDETDLKDWAAKLLMLLNS